MVECRHIRNQVIFLKDRIDLSELASSQSHPQEDWKQIFTDAWRMERDYFYDKNMHGVDWKAMHDQIPAAS